MDIIWTAADFVVAQQQLKDGSRVLVCATFTK